MYRVLIGVCFQNGRQDVFQSNDRRSCDSESLRCSAIELRRCDYESRRWDSNPQPPASDACTPIRQSVMFSTYLVQRPNEVVAETRCLGHQVNSLDVVPAGSWALRDAGGSRTHFDRVAAGCRAVWLQRRSVSVLARNRTWSTTSAKSCAVRHTPRTSNSSSPPRNRTPSCRSEVCRAVHHTRRP